MTLITGIVAIAKNGVIGDRDGEMPWPRDAEDLAFFRQQTMGKPCLMGRKTHDLMNRAGVKWGSRVPFVLSRSGKRGYFDNIDYAISCASHLSDQVMVIGGGQIYWNMMRHMDNLIVTHIEGEYEGTTFFKPDESSLWQKVCMIGRRSIYSRISREMTRRT